MRINKIEIFFFFLTESLTTVWRAGAIKCLANEAVISSFHLRDMLPLKLN